MKVRDVLKHKGSVVETVESSEPLAAAIRRFRASKIRALVVTEGGRLVGMLAMRDVLARIDERGPQAIEESVAQAMTEDVTTIQPGSSLEEVNEVFNTLGIHHLPVVEGDALVGLVTPFDVLSHHVMDLDHERELIRAYITNAVF